jgi:UDP-N-acetylmuramoyl-L-alanyl-D-glutamate--2,6-diaminopimelate ligase
MTATMPTLADIIQHIAPQHVAGALPDVRVAAVTADSRAVTPGTLFFAVSGGSVDGHRFAADALARGAVAVVGTQMRAALEEAGLLSVGTPYIQVTESRAALAAAAALLQGFPSHSLAVIGVTGTDGKTTTSSIIESILVAATRSAEAPAGRVGVVTTVGARIGGREIDTGFHVTTPDAPDVQQYLADMRDAGCIYAVVESTSHGLHQQRVGSVAYDVAVVTNITHEHLDYHGTRDAYVAAKALLFRALLADKAKPGIPRCAVLNRDDAGSYGALQAALTDETTRTGRNVTQRSYSMQAQTGADVHARNTIYAPDATRFDVQWWGGAPFALASRLIGDFNVANVLAATTAALALGIAPQTIAQGVAEFPGVLGRMERMDRGQPFTAIVDFAHSPASLERALQTLRPLVGKDPSGAPARLIAIFGSAGLRDRTKRRWMGQISGRLADYTIITAEDPRTEDVHAICAEIEAGVREHAGPERYCIVADRTEAIRQAIALAQPGDIVAAFGKGHERSMCYGETEHPWSDQAVMLAALDARR